MSIKKTFGLILALALVTFVVLALMLKQPAPTLTKPHKELLPVVAIELVQLTQQPLNFVLQASLEAQQQLSLSSDLAARVDWLAPQFVEGGLVKQGQVLLRLRKTEFELALAQAQAAVAQQRLAFLEEEALSQQAADDWRSVSGTIQSSTASELTLRKPQYALAKANYEAAKIALKQAKIDLANCEIKAPFNAYIGARQVELGQFIQANTQLAELIGTDKAQLKLPIKPTQVALLPRDLNKLKAQLIDVNDELSAQLKLQHLQAGVDAQAQVYYLLAYLDDPYALQIGSNARWYIGQFVDINLSGVALAASYKVPAASLHEDKYLYVLEPNQTDVERSEAKIKRLQAHIILRHGDFVYLELDDKKSPLHELEVITNDPGFLVSGMTVRIAKAKPQKQVLADLPVDTKAQVHK